MTKGIVKIALIVAVLPLVGFYYAPSAYAATLSNAKDTITNSRPSASAWLNADYAATDNTITITNNGSRYLASDSARLLNSTGVPLGSVLTIASQSADLTTIYLTGSSGTVAW